MKLTGDDFSREKQPGDYTYHFTKLNDSYSFLNLNLYFLLKIKLEAKNLQRIIYNWFLPFHVNLREAFQKCIVYCKLSCTPAKIFFHFRTFFFLIKPNRHFWLSPNSITHSSDAPDFYNIHLASSLLLHSFRCLTS